MISDILYLTNCDCFGASLSVIARSVATKQSRHFPLFVIDHPVIARLSTSCHPEPTLRRISPLPSKVVIAIDQSKPKPRAKGVVGGNRNPPQQSLRAEGEAISPHSPNRHCEGGAATKQSQL